MSDNGTALSVRVPAFPSLHEECKRAGVVTSFPRPDEYDESAVVLGTAGTVSFGPGLASCDARAPRPPQRFVSARTTEPSRTLKENMLAADAGIAAVKSLRAPEGACRRAVWWLETFAKHSASLDLPFLAPHVSLSDGEVVFEWWRAARKLTVYVNENELQFIRVWGPNIFDEMEEGRLESGKEERRVWRWLVNGH